MFLTDKIFDVTADTFDALALEVFAYQYQQVPVYREYCVLQKRSPDNVKTVYDIPFLPIELFKTRQVMDETKQVQAIFESSTTTGNVPAKHYVADLHLYEQSFTKCFHFFFGAVTDYVILAVLPSYLERGNSSLVYMADKLIQHSKQNASSFVKDEDGYLYDLLDVLRTSQRKTILLGVTFALMDFAVKHKIDFPSLIVMETGGMKGRREELTREEVHLELRTSFGVHKIFSEYGMTEMLSQAYSKGDGVFQAPPWLKVFTRDLYEPNRILPVGATGAVNIIDLANIHSCSFLATGDLGKVNSDFSFEILGRVTGAEVRGCNLMSL
ncbi:MAG: acyl transferase [Bacteroidetes bacterium]|nr:acyl transferase [Bacteroidota bacterium]